MYRRFYAGKTLHIHVNVCDTVQLLTGFLTCNDGKLKKTEDFKCVSSCIVCKNQNRSALVSELLSNKSLFVGQFYEDKSLALHAHDMIFFATYLQTVNYYTTIHC